MNIQATLLSIAFFFTLFTTSFFKKEDAIALPAKSTTIPGNVVRTLIIDAGHGGVDPGAKGDYSTEADVSLAVALKFGKLVEKEFPDIKVLYTRTKDVLPGNKTNKDDANRWRASFANQSGGDLFIAFHCNAAPNIPHKQLTGYKTSSYYKGKGKKRRKITTKTPQYRRWTTPNPAHGTETYIWAVGKNDAKVNAVNLNEEYYGEADSASTLSLPDPSDPTEKARMLIYAQQYFKRSLSLATFVENEFVASGRFSRGVKQRNHMGIWVLQATGMPSILVELGFLTNNNDEAYLNSENGQNEMAEDVLQALRNYKGKSMNRPVSAVSK